MDKQEFRVAAMRQVFGGDIKNVQWNNSKPNYTPDKSPYTLHVDTRLLSRHRGSVNQTRGFTMDDKGGIAGAGRRAETFHKAPDTPDKKALMEEIDRRYYAAAGIPPGTTIKKGEQGRATLWKQVRDEVLFQHEYIANLPPEVKKMIEFSLEGRVLAPGDYDQLFRIAKKIERMKVGQVGDYVSKLNGSTTDLNDFEASVDRYIAEMAKRQQDADQREKTKIKLVGLEETYKLYRAYRAALGIEVLAPGVALLQSVIGKVVADKDLRPSAELRKRLEASLEANGFSSIADKRVDKAKLATSNVDGLQCLLLEHIADKMCDVRRARGQIESSPSLIYKMDKMFPQFYAQQSIAPGSIFDNIIRDKLEDDAIKNLVTGIIVAIVAVALTVVSLGTATPALVAAGAAAGAFGISAYMAYDEFHEYIEEKDLADVGLARDPSVVWLVVAIAGAALDMGAAVKAVKALGPAAKALNGGDHIKDFTKAVKALQEAGEIDAKIARAAEKAARARVAFRQARGDLIRALTSKAYSFPGPLADPDVYRALVMMAKAKIQESGANIVGFINEVKAARAASKFGELSPEELTRAKQAYEQAQAMLESADASALQRTLFPTPHGGQVEVVARGKAVVPTGKVEQYARGKSVEFTQGMKQELRNLKHKRQTARKEFDGNPENAKRIKKLEALKHNYERSQEMNKTLEGAGFKDTAVDNDKIIEHLLEVGQNIDKKNSVRHASVIEGPEGSIKFLSTWKVLPDESVYLTTVQLIPIK